MDVDKLKKWLDVAQQFQGKDFWNEIFDETPGQPFHTSNKPPESSQNEKPQHKPVPQPATDLYQTGTDWVIVVDLPGINKSDIQLTCVRNVLTVKGEANSLFPDAEIVHSERLCGQFERTINLPENLDGAKPIASFKNGLLIVRIPRSPLKTFQIDID